MIPVRICNVLIDNKQLWSGVFLSCNIFVIQARITIWHCFQTESFVLVLQDIKSHQFKVVKVIKVFHRNFIRTFYFSLETNSVIVEIYQLSFRNRNRTRQRNHVGKSTKICQLLPNMQAVTQKLFEAFWQ